jgi:hypothetical protein
MNNKKNFYNKAKVTALVLGLLTEFTGGGLVQAALLDRGGGLIYDDILDVTWLQDANYAKTSGYITPEGRDVTLSSGGMTWSEAKVWADNLNYNDTVNNTTWSNWRLPTLTPINGSEITETAQTDGGTDGSYNVSAPGSAFAGSTASELAYMFYNNLGNEALFQVGVDTWQDPTPSGYKGDNFNTGIFDITSELEGVYITNTNEGLTFGDVDAWAFKFIVGFQSGFNGAAPLNLAWAVADGDIAGASTIPVPAAVWLFGSGLIGLLGFAKRKHG